MGRLFPVLCSQTTLEPFCGCYAIKKGLSGLTNPHLLPFAGPQKVRGTFEPLTLAVKENGTPLHQLDVLLLFVVIVQSLNCVRLCHPMNCSTPGFPVLNCLMSIELMMPSNHLILCHPLLLLPSICPSIRVFSNEIGRAHV